MQLNSKVCLERLLKYVNINEADLITKYGYSALNDIETIKQDLDKLEKLEKVIEILKEYLMIKVSINIYGDYTLDACDYAIPHLDKEQYELLKEVLGNKC